LNGTSIGGLTSTHTGAAASAFSVLNTCPALPGAAIAKLEKTALALFAVEVALSRCWLSRFYYGPLEWLWRSATYARWQPLRN